MDYRTKNITFQKFSKVKDSWSYYARRISTIIICKKNDQDSKRKTRIPILNFKNRNLGNATF